MKTVYIEAHNLPDVTFTIYRPHADGTDVEETMIGFYPLFSDVEFKGEPHVLVAYFELLLNNLKKVALEADLSHRRGTLNVAAKVIDGLNIYRMKHGADHRPEKVEYEWRRVEF